MSALALVKQASQRVTVTPSITQLKGAACGSLFCAGKTAWKLLDAAIEVKLNIGVCRSICIARLACPLIIGVTSCANHTKTGLLGKYE